MGLRNCDCEKIQEKNGAAVYRVRTVQGCRILKVFEHDPREILFYDMLRACGVPTVPVLAQTDRALLLEDLVGSPDWRLGQTEDLRNPRIAQTIAAWYSQLHEAGRTRLLLDELPNVTKLPNQANLQALAKQFPNDAFWPLLFAYERPLRQQLDALPRTLVYNDFYWTNLAVSRDGEAAMLFDYNHAGRGYAYSDVRNVVSSLSEEAACAFLDAYGPVNQDECTFDRLAADIIALWNASRKGRFPQWAQSSRTRLMDGTLLRNLHCIMTK